MDFLLDPTFGFISSVAAVFIYVALLAVRAGQREQEPIQRSDETTPIIASETVVAPEPVVQKVAPSIDTPKEPIISEIPAPIKSESSVPAVSVKDRLQKTRTGFFGSIASLFSSSPKLSADVIEELQYLLISGDLGVKTTTRVIENVKGSLTKGEDVSEEALIERLKIEVGKSLVEATPNTGLESLTGSRATPYISLIVGVNGVGKTTTTAKLASRLKANGLKVMLVAADTFRAAAVEQLQTWGHRLDVPVVTGNEANAKPQTVVFEAMKKASEEPFDLILIDTAGRLNNKANLMQELAGIKNAVERHFPSGVDEVLMVVDGTTGQNAVAQAKEFHSVVNLTGLIITKLDGTPKGGVVVAVSEEISVPVRYIGIGEAAEDLRPFDKEEFIEALFSKEDKVLTTESAHGETRKRKRRAA